MGNKSHSVIIKLMNNNIICIKHVCHVITERTGVVPTLHYGFSIVCYYWLDIGPAPAISRLGINPYQWGTECLSGDVGAGPATSFPQSIGMVKVDM